MKPTVTKNLLRRLILLLALLTSASTWAQHQVTVSTQLYDSSTTTYLDTDIGGSADVVDESSPSSTDVILIVAPNEGYTFKEWRVTQGTITINAVSGESGTYSFTMPDEDVALTAVFELETNYFCVITQASIEEGGSVKVSDDQTNWGSSVTLTPTDAETVYLTATSIAGYHFIKWKVTGNATIDNATSPSATLTSLSGVVTATAVFGYVLTSETSPAGSGSVQVGLDNAVWSSSIATIANELVYIRTAPNTGYVFKEWQASDNVYIDDASSAETTIHMPDEDATVTAVYVADEAAGYHTVSGIVVSGEGTVQFSKDNQTWTSSVVAKDGETVYFSCTPASGYQNPSFTIEGATYSSNTITMGNEDATLKATFEEIPTTHSLSTAAYPSDGGTLKVSLDNSNWSSSVNVKINETVYLSATPSTGYWFRKWQVNGSATIDAPYCPTAKLTALNENVTLTAVFHQGLYVDSYTEGNITVDGNKVHVTANEGYYVQTVAWNSAEELAGTEAIPPHILYPSADGNYEIPVSKGIVSVIFEKRTEPVIVKFSMHGHGTYLGNQDRQLGEKVVRPTDPTADDYVFLGWYTDNGCKRLYDFNTVLDKSLRKASDHYYLLLYAGWARASEISGTCGDNLRWEFKKSEGSPDYDLLEISGSGAMKDFASKVPWYSLRYKIKKVSIGKDVTTIGKNAFSSCENLTSITIPDGVTIIGEKALNKCNNLTSITIPVHVESIGKNAFSGCSQLTSLTIPASVTSIGKNAFSGCSGVTTLTVDMNTINKGVFTSFKNLETLTIGDNVKTIGEKAFSGFKNLATLNLGDNVETIGDKAFPKMGFLTTDIIIPASVTSIGQSVFSGVASGKNNLEIRISTAKDSKLTYIGSNAFAISNAYIDLRESGLLTEIGQNKSSTQKASTKVFNAYLKQVILPSSVIRISKKTIISKKATGPVYFPVPEDKILFVNGGEYKEEDLKNERFANLSIYDNVRSDITLNLLNGPTAKNAITITDGICEAYYPGMNPKPITEARPGETVVLSCDGEKIPIDKYVTEFNITKAGGGTFKATANEDNTDYTFIMPNEAVTVTATLSDQETFILDLTSEAQVIVPENVLMLMQTLMGYTDYDQTLKNQCIDMNRDGMPDLELRQPVEDGKWADPNDEFSNDFSVKRLTGADQVTKNYLLTFDYPVRYRFNKVLVKLNNSYPEQEQPKMELLDDGYDNSTTITSWADGTTNHNVYITERTLYKDDDWNTLCLPFDVTIAGSVLDATGVEARKLTSASIEGTTLTLNFSNPVATLEAGVPYIIKWTAAAQDIYEPVFYNVTVPDIGITDADRADENAHALMEAKLDDFLATKGYDNGADKGGLRVRFLGTFSSVRFQTEDKSILLLGAKNKLYWPKPVTKDPTQPWSDKNPYIYPELHAFRAYIKIGDGTQLAREFTTFNFSFGDGEASGITDAVANSSLFTIHSSLSEWYTLDGRKLDKQPTKSGLYIHNGNKVVIK